MASVVRLISFPGTAILMRVGRELTAAETEAYLRDLAYTNEYDFALDLQSIVEANAVAAMHVIRTIEASSYDSMLTPTARRDATREANRALINFLTSMRLILDHMQTRLTRHYGKNSPLADAFRRVTATVHDRSRPYRVLYNMRNYTQHCGMPIREVTVDAKQVEGAIVRRVAVACDVQTMLDRFSDWRFAKPDLELLRPAFAIGPFVAEVVKNLVEISDELRALEITEVRDATERVVTLIREAAGSDPKGAVVDVVTDANKSQFRFLVPAERLLQQLGHDASIVGRV